METLLSSPLPFLLLIIGLIAGFIIGKSRATKVIQDLATLNERLVNRDQQLELQQKQIDQLRALEDSHEELLAQSREEISTLKERVRNEEQKMIEFQALQEKFSETFKALSSDALKSNNQSFLELAAQSLQKFQEGARNDLDKRQLAIDSLIKPIQENLLRVDTSISELEKNRLSAFASLDQHLKNLSQTQTSLMDQTSNLVKALRTPNVRGRWGEIQLQRVVEIAGMMEHCDFYQQESFDDEGKRYRPDMIVRLPGGKSVVVDSKAPLQGYLDALEAKDDASKLAAFTSHARQIRTHINQLGQKKYWEQLKETPEFVVLFLPGENFFSAALEYDPQLIEHGVEQKVIVATPTTLIALLRAISYGWRQEQLEKNAREISELGKELYERLAIFAGHFSDIKKGLEKSVEGYNRAVASLESRVLISARRFRDLGAAGNQAISELEGIDSAPRALDMMRVNGQS